MLDISTLEYYNRAYIGKVTKIKMGGGSVMKKAIIICSFIFLPWLFPSDSFTLSYDPFSFLNVEQRGCCSWHGGVCGCSGGRQLCCDGTLSPSCTCHH